MKYTWLMILTLLLTNACNNNPTEQLETEAAAGTREENSPPPAEEPSYTLAMLSDKTDYVCGMELEDGGIADTAQYDGKVYGFCHTDCKTEFLKDPTAYIKK